MPRRMNEPVSEHTILRLNQKKKITLSSLCDMKEEGMEN